jgi:2-aminoethylphosphonate-pyruvate transaminase
MLQEPTVPPAASTLLNPGPVNVHPEVREALTYPDICHREAEVAALMRRVRRNLTTLCGGGDDDDTVLLTGSGTAALEAAISSIVPADGAILILDNGNYGERLYRIAAVHGIAHTRLEFGWNEPIDVARVDRALAADPAITHVAMVQHETSTGMLNPVREVGAVVARHGRSLAVDAISSLGCERFDLRADHVDWCVGTANKCLEGLPGISFVTAPKARLHELAAVPPRSYYLDLHGHYISQEQRDAPLFTPAVQVLYAFDRAVDRALDETVAGRSARYAALARQLRDGLRSRGLRLLLEPRHLSNSVTNVHLPDGIAYADLHDGLKAEGFTVYGVQAQLGEVFRVANMGQVDSARISAFLGALDRVLARLGYSPDRTPAHA